MITRGEGAPYARAAVPSPEHFVPLFIAMGSGDPETEPQVVNRHYDLGTLSYLFLSGVKVARALPDRKPNDRFD